MWNVFCAVFVIFGTLVGSGFSSGKEIMVFFSRFGVLSYLYIFVAFVFFFLLLFLLLANGKIVSASFEKSKILHCVVFFVSIVFCSSMFAGVKNLFSYLPGKMCVLALIFLVFGCVFVTMKGMKGLEKLNFFLMPITTVIFLCVLVFEASLKSHFSLVTNSWAGVLYCPLYVSLNVSMSSLVIAKLGEKLNKKQAFFVSLFVSVLILSFLLLGNVVLQKNPQTISSEMPFLSLVNGNKIAFALCYFVIFVGCFTTLISLCLTLKGSFQIFVKNDFCATLFAVLVPLLVSILGFSQIVSFLYPICSVLGVFVLVYVFFVMAEKKIFNPKK